MITRRFFATVAAAALVAAACTRADEGFRPMFEEEPCPADVTATVLAPAICGYLTVLERRDRPDGATIRLFVVRIEPPGEPSPDPMVAVAETLGHRINYGSLAPLAARTHRTIYLLDQRGTGLSEPNLTCPEVRDQAPTLHGMRLSDPRHATVYLDAVRACHARLTGQGVDLSAYTLAESATDVADLRVALGLDLVNVIGFGTGSRIALEILRRHPDGVRTAVLDSPDLPGVSDLTHAVARIEDALATVGLACAPVDDCYGAGPDLVGAAREVVAGLDAEPIALTVDGAAVVLDGALLIRLVRQLMTSAGGRNLAEVPRLIAQLRGGDPAELAPEAFRVDEGLCLGYLPRCEARLVHGIYYSILCHDVAPFSSVARLPAGAPKGYAEAYRQHPYRDVCAVWDVGQAEPAIAEPVRSEVPVLAVTGVYDAFTRPDEVREAATGLTASHIIEVPNHGYNAFGYYECPRNIRRAWLDNPTAPPGDTSCLDSEIHDPFG